jgi:hypothetical protein
VAKNDLLYGQSTHNWNRLASSNSSILLTDGSGNVSWGSILPTGTTATTQSFGDNSTKIATTAFVCDNQGDYTIFSYQALGSVIKAQTIGENINNISSLASPISQKVYFSAIYLPFAQTLTGVKWFQGAQGSYTASNYNGIGIYSYSGGTLTLVASSTNNGSIWKGTANTVGSQAFSGTYAAAAGVYYVALMYSSSAVTTAPTVGVSAGVAVAGVYSLDFTNSAGLNMALVTQTALPTPTVSASTLSNATLSIWVGVY